MWMVSKWIHNTEPSKKQSTACLYVRDFKYLKPNMICSRFFMLMIHFIVCWNCSSILLRTSYSIPVLNRVYLARLITPIIRTSNDEVYYFDALTSKSTYQQKWYRLLYMTSAKFSTIFSAWWETLFTARIKSVLRCLIEFPSLTLEQYRS